MSVKIDGEIETTSIEDLDFEYEPPCELNLVAFEECEHAAEWKIVLGCCATTFLFCEDHFLYVMDELKSHMHEHNPDFGGCGGIISVAHHEKFKVKA